MAPTSGAATIRNASSSAAWIIPDAGPRLPAFTLVAVRAMVPVTQKPPNRPAPILASPCPISSSSGRMRVPAIWSATIADRSDSIAPSKVKPTAKGSAA